MNRRFAIKTILGSVFTLTSISSMNVLANIMGKLKAVDAINDITGGTHSASNKLIVNLPKLAENGAQVPVSVDATRLNGVKSIYLIVHENQKPVAMQVDFESADALAYAGFRVKMGAPTKVTAIAKTESGFVSATGHTKVTKGGC